MTISWIDVNKSLPECGEEVIVIIDGHRGPSWRNNYPLIAYRTASGEWREERHLDSPPVEGVIQWAHLEY